MFAMITGFFSSSKNIMMAIGAAVIGGYVAKQKYDAYQAESKLKDIETKIAKTNVIVAKEKAKAKAKAVEVETSTHIEVLKELKVQEKEVLKEMDALEEVIEKTQAKKAEVKGRKRGESFTVSN